MQVATRKKWMTYTIVAAFCGVFVYAVLAPAPTSDPALLSDPTKDTPVQARLRCAAKSVALQQQVYAENQAGAPMPAYVDELEDRVNRLHRFVRGLTQSNDPNSAAFRPIMIAEEAARDAAVAVDAAGYARDAWAGVQACDTFYNGDLS